MTRFSGRFSTPAPDSGTFRTNDEPIVLGAGAFDAGLGSPSYSRTGPNSRSYGWLVARDEILGAQFIVPSGWSTVDVTVIYMKPTTNNGDVEWRFSLVDGADGEVPQTIVHDEPTRTVPTTQWELDYYTPLSGQTVTPGQLVNFQAGRLSLNDTLTGDIVVLGAYISKAS